MKVLIIVGNFKGGGVQKVFCTLANTFSELSYFVEIVRLTHDDDGHLIFDPNVVVSRRSYTRSIFSIFDLIKILRRTDDDTVVLTGQPHINVLVLLVSAISRSKSKIFISEHNPIFVSTNKKDHFVQRVKRYVYGLASGIVFVSKSIQSEYITHKFPDSVPMVTIRNPVNVSGELSSAQTEKTFSDAVSHEGMRVILSIGRLHQQKNFLLGIKTVANLIRAGEKIKYFILGEGVERNRLEKEIREQRMSENIFLLGFKRSVYSYLNKADLLFLPSRWEGFGLVVVEALSFGVNVVSSNVPGPKEILGDGEYGWVAENDVESLGYAITSALLMPKPRYKLVQRAKFYTDTNRIALEYIDFFNRNINVN